MPASRRTRWLGVVALGAVAVGATGFFLTRAPTSPPVAEADRALGLDHASVHLHLVLRQRLATSDAWAARLGEAVESRRAAEGLASELFDARLDGARRLAEGRDDGPVLTALGSPLTDLDTERATLLLAYVVAQGRHEDAGPLPVATYEASRLDASRLPPALRGLADAARALVFSSGDHCDRVRELARRDEVGPSPDELRAWLSDLDADAVAADLEHSRRLLLDGAVACCALRDGSPVEAAKRIEATAFDARALGVAAERDVLLRAFAATARGDRDEARALLDQVGVDTLSVADRERHRMLRDAVASTRRQALDDASVRLVDRDWLMSAVLEAVVDALSRDGLLVHLEARPEADAARRFLAGEAHVMRAARELHPFFDQAHLAQRTNRLN
ncbi:MAG: hypothetical protein H6722_24640 [Sandaracinus sp.]|nr:hypothetical protein [Sandaracinus sp.]